MTDSPKTRPHRHLRLVMDEHERERSDLAHRLHDQLAQSLAAVLLGLDGLERRARTADATRVTALREQLADAMSLCTELAVGLRPAVLDELGLAPAVHSLAERTGVDQVSVDPALAAVRLEPGLETEVYRAVEDALAAMAPGHTAALTLEVAGDTLLLSIHGTDRASEIGDLARLEARTDLVGATLDAGPHGVHMTIPIRAAAATAASVFPQPRRVETPDGARLAVP